MILNADRLHLKLISRPKIDATLGHHTANGLCGRPVLTGGLLGDATMGHQGASHVQTAPLHLMLVALFGTHSLLN